MKQNSAIGSQRHANTHNQTHTHTQEAFYDER